ncbi:MAG: hypothetical protein PHF86_05400 [Candidatus Nanoarchaeia archaeon]|nr:hypothetical protein [Candidatus Nanoarchaeia archaeon]
MNKKKIMGIIGLVSLISIGTYFLKRDTYEYTKPSEIVQEVIQEKIKNKSVREKVEKQIKLYNVYLQNKNKKEISRIFLSDCSGLSKSKKERYLQDIINNNYKIEFNFLHVYGDGLKVGISLNNSADILEGTWVNDLHLRCNYFE